MTPKPGNSAIRRPGSPDPRAKKKQAKPSPSKPPLTSSSANMADDLPIKPEWPTNQPTPPAIARRIIALHLQGISAQKIAKELHLPVKTVLRLNKRADSEIANLRQSVLIDILRIEYVKILDAHKLVASDLTLDYIRTQTKKKSATTDKERDAYSKQGLVLGSKLIDNNKAFVTIISTMGVPHTPTSTDNGSHPDSPTNGKISDPYTGLSESEIKKKVKEGLVRQLEYLEVVEEEKK